MPEQHCELSLQRPLIAVQGGWQSCVALAQTSPGVQHVETEGVHAP